MGDERIVAPSNQDTTSNLYPVDDIDGSSEEIAVKFESLWHDAVASSEESVQEAFRTALERLHQRSLHLSQNTSRAED